MSERSGVCGWWSTPYRPFYLNPHTTLHNPRVGDGSTKGISYTLCEPYIQSQGVGIFPGKDVNKPSTLHNKWGPLGPQIVAKKQNRVWSARTPFIAKVWSARTPEGGVRLDPYKRYIYKYIYSSL